MDGTDSAERQREIPSFLEGIERTLKIREDLQARLESQLSAVLRQEPQGKTAGNDVTHETLTPLGRRISELISVMERLNTNLSDLIDHIEV